MAHRVSLPALCILCMVGAARAEAPDSSTAAREWTARFHKCTAEIFSLTGKFVQDFTCNTPRNAPKLSGRFEVKRNGNYRISYDPPFAAVLVSDGETATAYQKRAPWIATAPVVPFLREIAGLLTGRVPENTALRHFGGAASPQEGPAVLRIDTPDHPHIAAVLLTVSADPPCIDRVIVVDAGGCIIRTTLTDIQVNTGVRSKRFRLKLPKYTPEITP